MSTSLLNWQDVRPGSTVAFSLPSVSTEAGTKYVRFHLEDSTTASVSAFLYLITPDLRKQRLDAILDQTYAVNSSSQAQTSPSVLTLQTATQLPIELEKTSLVWSLDTWVEPKENSMPTPIATPAPSPTPMATPASSPVPTPTPVSTPTISPTPTPSGVSLATPTPTSSPTPTPTSQLATQQQLEVLSDTSSPSPSPFNPHSAVLGERTGTTSSLATLSKSHILVWVIGLAVLLCSILCLIWYKRRQGCKL